MLIEILGLILMTLSTLVYSSIHVAGHEDVDLRKFMEYGILVVFALSIQGITGLLVRFGADLSLHTFYGYAIFLSILIYVTSSFLKKLWSMGKFKIGKEAFDLLIYVLVLTSFCERVLDHLLRYFEIETVRMFTITLVVSITFILLGLSVYGLKIYRELIALAEPVNLIPPIKTSCLAFALYGALGIFIPVSECPCILALVGHVALFVSALQVLYEITSKYYIPSKTVKI